MVEFVGKFAERSPYHFVYFLPTRACTQSTVDRPPGHFRNTIR